MSDSIHDCWRFEPGIFTITRNASVVLVPADVQSSLARHLAGDWGIACKADQLENEFSLDKPLRLFSVYEDSNRRRFWIITEADRSQTTILLPEDY